MHFLIVNDYPNTQEYIRWRLQETDNQLSITVASTEREAYELMDNHSVDAAIVDSQLSPVVDFSGDEGARILSSLCVKHPKCWRILYTNRPYHRASLRAFYDDLVIYDRDSRELKEQLTTAFKRARQHYSTIDPHETVALAIRTFSESLCELVAKDPQTLQKIEWRDLERLVAEALIKLGFSVTLTPGSKDGGKDIVVQFIAQQLRHTYYIELKHWRSATQPGSSDLAHFVEVNVRDNTDGGLFISTTGFTRPVYSRITEFRNKCVHLGEEAKIVSLCRNYVLKKNGLWQSDVGLQEVLLADTIGGP